MGGRMLARSSLSCHVRRAHTRSALHGQTGVIRRVGHVKAAPRIAQVAKLQLRRPSRQLQQRQHAYEHADSLSARRMRGRHLVVPLSTVLRARVLWCPL